MISPAESERVPITVALDIRRRMRFHAPPATASWRELATDMDVRALNMTMLSPAERVVAALLQQGLSNKEIARVLGKSEFTVKHQVSAILAKTGAPTRARLMALLR